MSSHDFPHPPPTGPYGYTDPYGGGRRPVDHPKGTTVFVLGIVSLVACAPLGIVALVMGNGALREIDASPGAYGNRQIVQAGRILGIVGIVVLVFYVVLVLLVVGVTFAGDSSP